MPTHIAALFVALAEIGGTPAKSSAGKERKLPPPATLFIAPADKRGQAGNENVRAADTPPRAIQRGALAFGNAIDAANVLERFELGQELVQMVEVADLHRQARYREPYR